MIMKRMTACLFGLVCILLAGCVLEDIEERGEVCPPGNLKNSSAGRYVAFSNMDCYEDYIELSSDMSEFGRSCNGCVETEEDSGTWQCSGDLSSCFESGYDSIKQNYVHCEHYRAHGVLSEGSRSTLGIVFVRDYFGTDVSQEEFESYDLSHSCPKEYEVCRYDGKYSDELDENGIPGGYGCFQSCTGNLIYCGEGNQRRCVNPENDSEYCGAQGDCSELNRGSVCENGMVCQEGECVCGNGFKACDNAGGVCVDIWHSSEHCGDSCRVCGEGKVCIEGSCVWYECGDKRGLCQKAGCKNTNEACGESCMDCTSIANVEEAICEEGQCTIIRCVDNYHIYKDDNFYECRQNSVQSCAPPEKPSNSDYAEIVDCTGIEHSKEVTCGSTGECVVKECEYGFEVSDSLTACTIHACIGCDPDSEMCYNGTCHCKSGWVSCSEDGGNCKDIINDRDNCGGCDIKCQLSNVNHMKENGYGCQRARCVVTDCDAGYHPFDQECEADDENNCGKHGRNCLNDIPHVASATCDYTNSKCIIDKCEKNWHPFEEECELDTKTDCNEHGHSCEVDGAIDVDCAWDDQKGHSVCVTKQCADGYHLAYDSDSIDGAMKCEKNDTVNCGTTGNKCLVTEDCVNLDGNYVCQCKDKLEKCGDECVDKNSNLNHCGACNHPCEGGQVCVGGKCECPSDKSNLCSTGCVAFGTNENCSGCGDVCQGGKQCNGTSCVCPSDIPNWCNDSCINFGTNEHCGFCGDACTGGKVCNGTSCQCPSSKPNWCNNSCMSFGTNEHCGSCNDKCTGGRSCSGGSCQCPNNKPDWCNGSCVNYQTDSNNCGSCGHSCDGESCSGGRCGCSFTKNGKVVNVNENVNIRSGPSTDSTLVGTYDKGETVSISCYKGKWYRMTTCNYVNKDYILPNGTTGLIDHTDVKVRQGPNSSTVLYIGVFDGRTVNIEDKEKGSDNYIWYKVSGNSTEGWLVGYIRSDLVSISDGVPAC